MSARRNYFRRWSPPWLVLILVAVALARAAPGYKVVNTHKVGGDGGWDYLTADAADAGQQFLLFTDGVGHDAA